MKTRYLAFPPLRIAQQPGTYIYADHSRSQSLSFRTALVAQERIHGRHGTIRDSYNAPIAENVPDNAVFADASHRDGLAVAATIADQSQMARRDAVWHLGVIGKKLVRCCRWSHPQMFGPLSQTTCGLGESAGKAAGYGRNQTSKTGGPKGHDFGSRKNGPIPRPEREPLIVPMAWRYLANNCALR